MKKTITTVVSVLLVASLQAQLTVDNFEGTNFGWEGLEGTAQVCTNLYKSGINLSEHVLYAERNVGANNWAGTILRNYKQTGYQYVHAYMYRNNTSVPNLKIFDSDDPVEFLPMNTIVANEWQDVVFDISAYASRGTDFLFFMVDRTEALSAQAWMLIDEVQLSNDATPRTAVVGEQKTEPSDYKAGYTLAWEDSFNGTRLDTEVWNYETGTGSQPEYNIWGWGNNELQYYTQEAVTLGTEPVSGNQCLILTATKEDYMGSPCTSGRINTLGKVYFTHGIVEASICFPQTANGLWPAFWMMGNDNNTAGWPQCGELDIIEMGNADGIKSGVSDRYFNGAAHYGVAWNDMTHGGNSITADYSLQDGKFHLLTCIWTKESVSFYYDLDKYPDHTPYYTLSLQDYSTYGAGTYFHKPNFILFNLAVGGDFTSIWDINGITALADGPRSMYVDYVRVYQKGEAGETMVGKTPQYTDRQDGLQDIAANREVLSVELYDLQGRRVSEQASGLLIRRIIFTDGQTQTDKVIR